MEPVTEWRIHIGAHKTATTHLQDTLDSQRSSLEASGVDYFPRDMVREFNLIKLFRRKSWRRFVPGHIYHRWWEDALATIRLGPQIVAISEENLLGGPKDLLAEKLYPDTESRLLSLASVLSSRNLHLFLSIRSFETLLPSAYAQSLRSRPIAGGFDAVRDRWLTRPLSWADLIDRIQLILPEAKLSVWKFEDYGAHSMEIISAFCGCSNVRDIHLPPPRTTMTPSATAVARIEALRPHRRRAKYRSEVMKICQADTGTDRYSPLTAEERAVLAGAYTRDLERIGAMGPGVHMRFD